MRHLRELKFVFSDKRIRMSALPFAALIGLGGAAFITVESAVRDAPNAQYPTVQPITFSKAASNEVSTFYEGAYRILDAWIFSPDATSVGYLIKNGDLMNAPSAPGSGAWTLSSHRIIEVKPVTSEFCALFNHGNAPSPAGATDGISGCYRNLDNQFVVYYHDERTRKKSSQYQILSGVTESAGDVKRLKIKRGEGIYSRCPTDAVNPGHSFFIREFRDFKVCIPVGKDDVMAKDLGVLYSGDRWQQNFRDSINQVNIGVFL